MAIAHLCVSVGKKGMAAPHAAYIARQGRHAARLGSGEKLEAIGIGNMPAWAAHDPLEFWSASDLHERKRGTTYREISVALPRELPPAVRVALVGELIENEIGMVHAYQWAIHNPLALDGRDQPHLHLMLSERRRDAFERAPNQYFRRFNSGSPERGGARKGFGSRAGQRLRGNERAAELQALRARWQELVNRYLERAGLAQRIDMRSHAVRGTGFMPEPKQTPSSWRGAGRDAVTEFRAAAADWSAAQELLHEIVPDPHAEILVVEAAVRGWDIQVDTVLEMFVKCASMRAQRAGGFDDSDRQWNAVEPSIHADIEHFNELQGALVAETLIHMRRGLRATPDLVNRLSEQLPVALEAQREGDRRG